MLMYLSAMSCNQFNLKIPCIKLICPMQKTASSRPPTRVVNRQLNASNILKEFFMKERKCDDAWFTPKERLRERQSLETKELLIELRSLLDSEMSKDSEFRSQYYTEALNYLNRFWKEIFAYLNDGELPIDNNLAERTIRKLTIQHNNSLHYGSDAGTEMAVTYHSVIGTVKLHGSSVCKRPILTYCLKE